MSAKKINPENNQVLIRELSALLEEGNAHVSFEEAVNNLPEPFRGEKPANLPYSIWQLVEHLRIAQWDILEFSRNPNYQSPKWPEGYWVKETAPADDEAWKNSLKQIKKDRKDFIALLESPGSDLYEPFPHGSGQNLLREALLIADHNSYHTGEIVIVRRLLGDWGK